MNTRNLALRECMRERAARAHLRIPAGVLVLAGVVALAGFSGTLYWAMQLRQDSLRRAFEAQRAELEHVKSQLAAVRARLEAQTAQASAELEPLRLDLAAQRRRLEEADPVPMLAVWRREADAIAARLGSLQQDLERLEREGAAWKTAVEQRLDALRGTEGSTAVAARGQQATGPSTTILLPREAPAAVAEPVLDGEP